jgi:hypothetical protein
MEHDKVIAEADEKEDVRGHPESPRESAGQLVASHCNSDRAAANSGKRAVAQRYCGVTVSVPVALCVAAEFNESRLFSVRS